MRSFAFMLPIKLVWIVYVTRVWQVRLNYVTNSCEFFTRCEEFVRILRFNKADTTIFTFYACSIETAQIFLFIFWLITGPLTWSTELVSAVKVSPTMFSLVTNPVWAKSWENLFMPYANNKGADQPAHPRSLISAFVVRCLVPLVSISEISSP